MRYAKYIGALVGFYFYGFWGALFGFLGGAYFGWKMSGGVFGEFGRVGKIGDLGANYTRTQRQAVFLQTTFRLMGRLAKADGRISETEIAHTEQFIKKLGMGATHRQTAIAMFKEGAQPEFNVEEALTEFKTVCGNVPNLKELLIVYVMGIAVADGVLHESETQLLNRIAGSLGYSPEALDKLLNMMRGQDQFAGGHYHYQGNGGAYTSPNALQAAYQALGVEDSNTDAEIKKAYRQLVKQYHPDRLMGQGVPESMIKEATKRSQEIQTAYDLIKKERGFK